MKCKIIHESRGRLRVHLECARMSLDEADVLEYYMRSVDGVDEVKVYDRTRGHMLLRRARRSDKCAGGVFVSRSGGDAACPGAHYP